MKVPLSWLRDYVDLPESVAQLAERLTLAGLEVASVRSLGLPFRDAHEAVGHLVVWCTVHDCDLDEVSDDDLASISPHLTPEVRDVLSVEGALAARSAPGGTAPDRVAEQLKAIRASIDEQAAWATGG